MKIKSEICEAIKQKISESDTIGIISHTHPDGDNLGSILGMYQALKINTDKKIEIVKVDDYPKIFNFLPNIEMLKEVEVDKKYDLLFVLDCGDAQRVGDYEALIEQAGFVINVDHHRTNTQFGDLNLVDIGACATAELIFELLKALEFKLDKKVATCLYTGISTDSGSFKYSNTTARTHQIAAELIGLDIDTESINVSIYQNQPYSKTLLLVESLSTLQMHHDNQLAIAYVTQEMLEKTESNMLDSEGIVEFMRDIQGVEVACFLKVYPTEIKASFRSKLQVDVASFAEKNNGGGHVRAAGCTFKEPLQRVISKIVNEIMHEA